VLEVDLEIRQASKREKSYSFSLMGFSFSPSNKTSARPSMSLGNSVSKTTLKEENPFSSPFQVKSSSDLLALRERVRDVSNSILSCFSVVLAQKSLVKESSAMVTSSGN
jgi:hypothetical protein